MKPTKHKTTGREWNGWIGKGAFFFLTTLIVLYGFFDITTSRQTYHIDYDRTASKILLLSIIIFPLFYCAGCLVTKKYRTKNFLDYFLSDYFGILIISIACLIISDLISFFVNKVALSVFSTTAIYYVLFISLSIFMRFWSFGNIQRHKTFLYSSLIIFFFYYFFILFYFFYIQGRPMSSGGLRIPVLSHVFFPLSLIPSLRLLLKRKIAYIYLLFFPLVIIADKASVFVVFIVYVASDLFHSTLFDRYRKQIETTLWCIAIAAILLLVFANFAPQQSLLYKKLSFNSVILSSGRLQNWTNIIKDFKCFSLKNFFFGKGASATTLVNYGIAAHNDFLESFYDYGLLGFASMISFASYFLINAIKVKNDSRHSLLLAFYVLFFMMISAIFSNANLLLCFSFSGVLTARQRVYEDKSGSSIYKNDLLWEMRI